MQQVNLYQPIFRKRKKVFSAVALLQVTGVVVAGFLLLYAHGMWRVQALNKDLDSLKSQRQSAIERLAVVERQLAGKRKSRVLVAEAARLERELDDKRRVADALASGRLGGHEGFSGHLEGLAQRHVEGTWVTGLDITGGGNDLELRGAALSPEQVPVLVGSLAKARAFKGMRFQVLRVRREESDEDRVDFTLSTVVKKD